MAVNSNANGSHIVNYPTGHPVSASDYTETTAQDIYARNKIEQAVINNNTGAPIIYNGLVVTTATGLNVNVSAGNARGLDVEFTGGDFTSTEPTYFGLDTNATNIACTDNSTGYIILAANIIAYDTDGDVIGTGPSQDGEYFEVVSSNTSSSTVVSLPYYVTSLPTNPNTSFPYTYVVLAKVTTLSGAITAIDTTYSLGNRSFDFTISPMIQQDATSTAPNNAVEIKNVNILDGSGNFTELTTPTAPTSAEDVTNKQYVDPIIVTASSDVPGYNNTKITWPGGLIEQIFYMAAIGGNASSNDYAFPWAFPTECFGMTAVDCGSATGPTASDASTASVIRVDNEIFYAWGRVGTTFPSPVTMCIHAKGR